MRELESLLYQYLLTQNESMYQKLLYIARTKYHLSNHFTPSIPTHHLHKTFDVLHKRYGVFPFNYKLLREWLERQRQQGIYIECNTQLIGDSIVGGYGIPGLSRPRSYKPVVEQVLWWIQEKGCRERRVYKYSACGIDVYDMTFFEKSINKTRVLWEVLLNGNWNRSCIEAATEGGHRSRYAGRTFWFETHSRLHLSYLLEAARCHVPIETTPEEEVELYKILHDMADDDGRMDWVCGGKIPLRNIIRKCSARWRRGGKEEGNLELARRGVLLDALKKI